MRIRPGLTLLELELVEAPLEDEPASLPARLAARHRSRLHQLTSAIRVAGDDPRVGGLIAHVAPGRLGLAAAAELRDAVRAFTASGKPALAWTETFGEGGPATAAYYLASGFSQIWLQPSGGVGFVGLAAGGLFFAEALARLGLKAQIGRRHEYKGAPERLTRTSFSEPQRQAVSEVLGSAFDAILAAVADSRGLAVPALRELAGRAPLTAAEALAAGLVDRLGYRDEAYAALHAQLPGGRLRYLARYRRSGPAVLVRRALSRGPTVGVVSLAGIIRFSGRGPFAGGPDARTVCAALRHAAESERLGAVVLRVNSPGGSYVASDSIWREVARCREAGKPVVVSMGEVAASGGYFVSAPADRIVAEPATLTGSIGVYAGKVVVADLLSRLGVGHDSVQTAPAAQATSPFREFTTEERERLESWLDLVYRDFVEKVAAGRRMTVTAVEELARGRVWSGADAATRGLVDVIGGLHTAVELARSLAGLAPAAAGTAGFVTYPRLSPLRRLRPPTSSEVPAAASWRLHSTLPRTLAGQLSALPTLLDGEQLLLAPALW
ncbi:MAG: signal peptide peptidase SppA [Mycobacteriales bacterium]